MITKKKMKSISKIIISLALAISSSDIAIAGLEKGDSSQNLLRGSLALKNDLILFNASGANLVDPTAASEASSSISLNRNSNGDLIWNGNPIIDANGNLISNSATFTNNVNAASFTGNLTGTASLSSIANALEPTATVNLANQVSGVLPVINGGTGTTTVTGSSGLNPDTASVVLNNAPTINGSLNLNGELALGRIDDTTCDISSEGLIRYNPLGCRLERCNGSDFLAPDARFHRAFVTFEVYPANLVSAANSFGSSTTNGLEAADFLCQKQADLVNLGGDFIAIISAVDANGNIVNAIDRIPKTADIKTLNGRFVNLCNLWDGFTDGAINTTNLGNTIDPGSVLNGNNSVWTGTNTNGSLGGSCGNWEGRDNSDTVITGFLLSNTSSWISNQLEACSSSASFRNYAHLYCVEKFNL